MKASPFIVSELGCGVVCIPVILHYSHAVTWSSLLLHHRIGKLLWSLIIQLCFGEDKAVAPQSASCCEDPINFHMVIAGFTFCGALIHIIAHCVTSVVWASWCCQWVHKAVWCFDLHRYISTRSRLLQGSSQILCSSSSWQGMRWTAACPFGSRPGSCLFVRHGKSYLAPCTRVTGVQMFPSNKLASCSTSKTGWLRSLASFWQLWCWRSYWQPLDPETKELTIVA